MNNFNSYVLLMIASAMILAFLGLSHSSNTASSELEVKKYEVSQNYKDYDSDVKLSVNTPPALTGTTKDEIYRVRKQYVSKSIFADSDYAPSEEVFGQIEDKKPWMSTDICKDKDNKIKITGISEEGRWIANPTMLVAIGYPYYFEYKEDAPWCKNPHSSLIPAEISYSPKKNEITVVYNALPFSTMGNGTRYALNGVNARDFGYSYFYVDKAKSSYAIQFAESSNPANNVQQFQNFIHTGGSCGHEGGCNNGSPRQTFAEFKADFIDYTADNRDIIIKLWHKRPISPSVPADITERIILKKS